MTITNTLPKLTASQTDVDLPILDKTKLMRRGTSIRNDGLGQNTRYTIADGDENVPVDINISIRDDDKLQKDGFQYRHNSFALEAQVLQVDSENAAGDKTWPITAVLAINVPHGAPMTVAMARQLIGNLYSLTIASISSTVITEGPLVNLGFGGTELFD